MVASGPSGLNIFRKLILPENYSCLSLFLPKHWTRRVRSAVRHVTALARFAAAHVRGRPNRLRVGNSSKPRPQCALMA